MMSKRKKKKKSRLEQQGDLIAAIAAAIATFHGGRDLNEMTDAEVDALMNALPILSASVIVYLFRPEHQAEALADHYEKMSAIIGVAQRTLGEQGATVQ